MSTRLAILFYILRALSFLRLRILVTSFQAAGGFILVPCFAYGDAAMLPAYSEPPMIAE
jgi:hypothetical protein